MTNDAREKRRPKTISAPALPDLPDESPDSADGQRGELSDTMRKYLAEIYRLSDHTQDSGSPYIGTSALADLLNVSAPAVNRMVSKLRDLNLLIHEPYQGVMLTENGAREALKQLRRQRIVEAFMVTVMRFGWHEIHEDAQRVSASIGDLLIERMWQMAGSPTVCPHGEPIATPDGVIVPPQDILLTHAPHKQALILTRVRTRERDRLEYLAALGLVPGVHLEILHAAPFNGPLQLRVAQEYRIIGHNLAEMLRVRAVS
jgi:DtxR family Mn-dependent transcriptional regulator